MNTLTTLLLSSALVLSASTALARDIDPARLRTLQENGTIQTTQALDEAALATHPGATITDTELESEYGKYIYKVELRDKNGIEWDLELDAVTGQVFENHRDN